MIKHIIKFFDKLEDKVRKRLSQTPIFYAVFGGVGIILFWRGVWLTADLLNEKLGAFDGPASILVGAIVLLMTGLFVSVFIGDQIILSGIRGEKKVSDKTEKEVETEEGLIKKMHNEIHGISKRIAHLEKNMAARPQDKEN